jgi:hypothetical protein
MVTRGQDMLIIRLGLVLFVIALFFPATPSEKEEAYQAISSLANDIGTFCQRNRSLCDNSRALADSIARRVAIGAQIVGEALFGNGETQRDGAPDRGYLDPPDRERIGRAAPDDAAQEGLYRRNTLRPSDFQVPWVGPDDAS